MMVTDKCHRWRKLNINQQSHVCGNTHVTCHMGVPSCGQCHRNTFKYIIISSLTRSTRHCLASPPYASSRTLFPFLTHPLPHHDLQVYPLVSDSSPPVTH